jgi:hypothetical protein
MRDNIWPFVWIAIAFTIMMVTMAESKDTMRSQEEIAATVYQLANGGYAVKVCCCEDRCAQYHYKTLYEVAEHLEGVWENE